MYSKPSWLLIYGELASQSNQSRLDQKIVSMFDKAHPPAQMNTLLSGYFHQSSFVSSLPI